MQLKSFFWWFAVFLRKTILHSVKNILGKYYIDILNIEIKVKSMVKIKLWSSQNEILRLKLDFHRLCVKCVFKLSEIMMLGNLYVYGSGFCSLTVKVKLINMNVNKNQCVKTVMWMYSMCVFSQVSFVILSSDILYFQTYRNDVVSWCFWRLWMSVRCVCVVIVRWV